MVVFVAAVVGCCDCISDWCCFWLLRLFLWLLLLVVVVVGCSNSCWLLLWLLMTIVGVTGCCCVYWRSLLFRFSESAMLGNIPQNISNVNVIFMTGVNGQE